MVGPPLGKPNANILEYYRDWIDRDGYPFWSFFENIKTWWEIRNLPNVLLLHFNNLKKDLPGEIRKIAAFLDIKIDPNKFNDIVHHCSFEYMKQNSSQILDIFPNFINKGINNRWKDILTEEDNQKYERLCLERLGKECTMWVNHGIINPPSSL